MENQIVPDKTSKQFGQDYVKEIIKALKSVKKSASGRLIKSLSSKVQDKGNEINIIINGEDYLTYVDEGRKRGSYPPIQAISQWAKLKGISQEAVFPIAQKIFQFGIKPTNVIDKATKSFMNGPSFGKFEDGIAKNLEEKVYNEIMKTSKEN